MECGIVKWPMSVVRLTGKNKDSIISLSSHILKSWRAYTDADVGIFAETDGEIHNTITPIAFTNVRGKIWAAWRRCEKKP